MPIADQLRDIFRPHFDGTNDAQFEILIQQRAERLQAMGETPATVAAVLAKGANRDRLAQTTVGFVRSVPFGIASRLFDVKQALTAFAKTTARVGATVGAGSGTADAFGAPCWARPPATHNGWRPRPITSNLSWRKRIRPCSPVWAGWLRR